MEIPSNYIIAEGPQGLEKVLNDLLSQSNANTPFAKEEHYVLYQLGNQKSLIKVDTDKTPFIFWHYDLMGRPATGAIKETVARFLFEKWGVKDA